jgi:hypothetical protein
MTKISFPRPFPPKLGHRIQIQIGTSSAAPGSLCPPPSSLPPPPWGLVLPGDQDPRPSRPPHRDPRHHREGRCQDTHHQEEWRCEGAATWGTEAPASWGECLSSLSLSHPPHLCRELFIGREYSPGMPISSLPLLLCLQTLVLKCMLLDSDLIQSLPMTCEWNQVQ